MTSCCMNFAIIIQWIYFTIWKKIKKNHHHYNIKYVVQLASWQLRSNSPKTSVRLSICLSVCHTFFTKFLSSYHHEIFRSYYDWQKWRPCNRSRSAVKGQGHKGQNPTYPFPDCNSNLNLPMATKWCAKLDVGQERCPIFFSRSSIKFQDHTGQKIVIFDPNWGFPDCNSSLNTQMAMKWCTKLEVA